MAWNGKRTLGGNFGGSFFAHKIGSKEKFQFTLPMSRKESGGLMVDRRFKLDIPCSKGYKMGMTPKQIRNLMKTLGMTQEQFADRIGAHRVTVADWVRGTNKPKGLYLKALNELANEVKRTKKGAKK